MADSEFSPRQFCGLEPSNRELRLGYSNTSPMGRCPSGQREQAVNLPAYAFGGSNPPRPTVFLPRRAPGCFAPRPSPPPGGAPAPRRQCLCPDGLPGASHRARLLRQVGPLPHGGSVCCAAVFLPRRAPGCFAGPSSYRWVAEGHTTRKLDRQPLVAARRVTAAVPSEPRPASGRTCGPPRVRFRPPRSHTRRAGRSTPRVHRRSWP